MEILSKPSVPVCELFSRSVKCFPRLTAIDHEDGVCTYDELDKLSTSFAMELLRLGVVAGQHIPFLTRHGTLNIIALLGVLKLGACFVPMDKDTWSSQRIDHVLASFEGGLLVPTVSEGFQHPAVQLPDILPGALACVICASGSSGIPKLVMTTHKAISNYVLTSPFNMDITPGERMFNVMSVAFNGLAGLLFSALANGGAVVPVSLHELHSQAISCAVFGLTPFLLSTLPAPAPRSKEGCSNDEYPLLWLIILSGEVPPLALLVFATEANTQHLRTD
ncbi:hypothetical protein DL95DRAFT_465579 [Leptodontidium sp. 2 PMI_412]|nr:hypothetical protein DL95DRAFT_465579 [Leptodontidium sp. 2 PMI_412]